MFAEKGGCYEKILKVSIVVALLCGVMSMSSIAGTVSFSRYNLGNTQKNWNSTGSFNTKAEAGQPWFIRITGISFGGADISASYGMAHAPGKYTGGSPTYFDEGNTYWSKTTTSGYAYMGWKVGYGTANRDYLMLVRLDSAITGTKSAYTLGLWNSW